VTVSFSPPASTLQCREHLARLIAVVVDRLLAEDDHPRLLVGSDLRQNLGDSERLHLRANIIWRLDEDRAVGAHRKRGAQSLLRFRRPDRHGNDLGRDALFLKPDRLFHGDLVERVHAHLDVGEIDAGAVHLHPRPDVEINDAFDRDQDFHSVLLPFNVIPAEAGISGEKKRDCRAPFSPRPQLSLGRRATPQPFPSPPRRSCARHRRDRWPG
jgi:hypothetical protein